MKKLTVWFLLVLALLISGCNTMHGMGEDLEQAGDEAEEALD